MKTFWLLLIILLSAGTVSQANHIRGGELTYKYLGAGSTPNSSRYEVTLKLFIDCFQNSQGQFDGSAPFTVFRKSNNSQLRAAFIAPFISESRIGYDPNSNPCITNPPTDICYNLRFYRTTIDLQDDPDGYIISFQRCCRIAGIENISGNSAATGATYLAEIPGTNTLAANEHNSSPEISGNDAVAICAGSGFEFDFSARDVNDGDSLTYQLCSAYDGGGRTQAEDCYTCPAPNPAAPPPYRGLPYQVNYPGTSPLGSSVSINRFTGIITGLAPDVVGQYVVTVCISEYRRGKLINVHRKDIHLKVSDCNPLKAVLNPDYKFCDDFNVSFQNGQVNPSGSIHVWDFGDGTKTDTSTAALGNVRHLYADTGTYRVKLMVMLPGGQCLDSAFTLAKVYPGFFPGFTYTGACLFTPFNFRDTSNTRYGTVNKWSWEFGDETTPLDVSTLQNPSYLYNSLGVKTVRLTVETNKGCQKIFTGTVDVLDKPALELPFRDTLICSIDSLQLQANSPGSLAPRFTWSPATNISNRNIANPLVYPKTTTTYIVDLEDNGCITRDSIRVRVVNEVTLSASADTTICLTDPIPLQAFGDGLKYQWTPAESLNDPTVSNPIATPTATTTYAVTASIGKCTKTGNINIRTVPYPGAFAGEDIIICYEDSIQLNATINGSSFSWSPQNTLIAPETLSPIAFPLTTTSYVLTVTDNKGCPKPGIDTVVVGVRPLVQAFAGNDTAIVVGQPLQLQGTGADIYVWEPSTGLNFTNIPNPIANLSQNQTYVLRVSTPEDCFSYDTINITLFRTNPDIFVPNAFTPGGSSNTVFRPRPVGIARFDYFRVYNRWGQLVFSTREANRGWDGNINGNAQGTGTYVWMVQGTDFTGKTIFKKGTMVLIR
ncbi:PKD domain-containing protein [Flavihumibacter sp. ZG627]|uniref:PKD domain-containing protein n=1 Tax=Flavihumibacter sp. ZG627 TaxID=1463156 RepID=UPI00057E6209|nr:PKD domain-containing protein [Flavihumibacter sp. ZG627]KIC89517.1 hypothetical protein HY58_16790 [Flavihumibacter sp. ZG627]